MKTPRLFIALSGIALIAASCSTPCPTPAEVETIDMDAVTAEIGALETAYQTASNDKDTEGLLAYYAEDAQSFPPNKEPRVGKEAMRAAMNENPNTGNGSMTLSTLDVWADGDIAVETGTWTDLDSSGAVAASGIYMSIFEKRDGKYVCIRDIWNSDMPEEKDDADEETEEAEM